MAASVSADDLGLYLNDAAISDERADFMIAQAETLCQSIVGSPLPDGAEVVVTRVAGRGYVTTATQNRAAQIALAGSPFGADTSMGFGGIFLTRQDKSDLRRLAGGTNAFTINPLAHYTEPELPLWDQESGVVVSVFTS